MLDQAPNSQHGEDMTETLFEKGYWAGYNRPWFEDVRAKTGVAEAEDLHGVLFSRDRSPRANIFRATVANIKTLAHMQSEMRRNRWPHEVDGGERNTPDHAIAARSDIDVSAPDPNGAVDSKVRFRSIATLCWCLNR